MLGRGVLRPLKNPPPAGACIRAPPSIYALTPVWRTWKQLQLRENPRPLSHSLFPSHTLPRSCAPLSSLCAALCVSFLGLGAQGTGLALAKGSLGPSGNPLRRCLQLASATFCSDLPGLPPSRSSQREDSVLRPKSHSLFLAPTLTLPSSYSCSFFCHSPTPPSNCRTETATSAAEK